MGEKVLVAMSGGVDSSVAALLLQQQGYEVSGATFLLYDGCGESNVPDARAVCEKLSIEHHVFDYREQFAKAVLDDFVYSYTTGKTPNPCITCNRKIKFGAFVRDAQQRGFQKISTGHYAGVCYDKRAKRYMLRCSTHKKKDQSYVLYHLTQEQLAMLVLPVEPYTKDAVRKIAAQAGLSVESKSDSQDICFVPDGDYTAFLERYAGIVPQPGNYIDDEGHVIGQHQGFWRYTIGQRKGLGVSFGKHRFVSRLDAKNNTVTLSDECSVFCSMLYANDLKLIAFDSLDAPLRAEAKIRYAHTPAPAEITPLGNGKVCVHFDTPQRAITPGQAVVFYDGEYVLGGATITGTEEAG